MVDVTTAVAPLGIDEVWAAWNRVRGRVKRTPMDSSRTLSERSGAQVYLKLENRQRAGSFKLRGALNVIETLSPEQRRGGVVTFSAGNWAQGVALAASAAGVPALLVMPEAAMSVKVEATRGYGAEVLLYGSNSVELEAKARQIAEQRGMTVISPFDNRPMMAGHATLGLEMLDDVPDPSFIFVPVGGGSLIAGVASAVKALSPATRVIGVSAEGAASVYRSLESGRVVELDTVQTIADGLAVKRPGETGFGVVRQVVDQVQLVSDDELRAAMAWALEREKTLLEPAGAAGLAGLLSGRVPVSGKVIVLFSGGNIPLARLLALLA
jgi:threonine ammonia-lyase medium form